MKYKTTMISVFVALAALNAGGERAYALDVETDYRVFNFEGESVVLPLKEQSLHPKVAIDFGDGAQYSFIVDTGAPVNVIDSSIAERMGYEVIGETGIGAPGGPQIPANIVRVPKARVGKATISQAEFVTMDIKAFSGGMTHGVLGMGLFEDFLLTFDYGQAQIRVSRDSLSAGNEGVLPYNASNRQIEIMLEVAGTPVATHIDTGSMGEFTLPGELRDTLPLRDAPQTGMKARLVGGERDIQFAQLDGIVSFAGFSYENPNIGFMTPSPGRGNIGSGILGDMLVSIDQQNSLISFVRPDPGSAKQKREKRRRLGVRFRGMSADGPLTVANVMPGSLAASAGFQAGDRLVSLNGKPSAEFDMAELGKLFGSSMPLNIGVERNGAVQMIEIP